MYKKNITNNDVNSLQKFYLVALKSAQRTAIDEQWEHTKNEHVRFQVPLNGGHKNVSEETGKINGNNVIKAHKKTMNKCSQTLKRKIKR